MSSFHEQEEEGNEKKDDERSSFISPRLSFPARSILPYHVHCFNRRGEEEGEALSPFLQREGGGEGDCRRRGSSFISPRPIPVLSPEASFLIKYYIVSTVEEEEEAIQVLNPSHNDEKEEGDDVSDFIHKSTFCRPQRLA